jgi:hypothetical protein
MPYWRRLRQFFKGRQGDNKVDAGEYAAWAGVVVTAIGLGLVVVQLRRGAKELELSGEANKNSNLMAVLALESSLSDARSKLAEVASQMALIANESKDNEGEEPVALTIVRLHYNERVEQYLNSADRLCACIIRGYVCETQYRQDYRPWISEIVKKHVDRLGPDTRHRNILKVNEAWSEDRNVSAS